MGQIKNITLHIVTDIKINMILVVHGMGQLPGNWPISNPLT